MSNMSDGLNMLPRPGEPESNMLAGMAVPAPKLTAGGDLGVGAHGMPDTSYPGPTALQEPGAWSYDFDPATGAARATFNGEVSFTSGGSGTAGVTTWNGRSGSVVLTGADVSGVGGAMTTSPTLTGVPQAPTASPGTSTQQIATTAFVAQAIVANPIVQSWNGRTGAVSLTLSDVTSVGGAPAASPALSGVPTAPTALGGNASGQIATTQFVANALGGVVDSWNGRVGAVTMTLSDVTSVGGAPLNSPTFTGVPSGPTAAPGTSTTELATTAFVTAAVTAGTAGVSSFNTRTGAVVLTTSDVSTVGGALTSSPSFTGTPQAPTPTAGTNNTTIATTAFVATALSAIAAVTSFNTRTGAVSLTAADVTNVGGALLAGPTFTGVPNAPTAAPATNTTQIATTAFVTAAVSAAGVAGVSSFNTRTGAVTLSAADVSGVGAAMTSGAAFTGTTTAPTPATADNSTNVATTAYVKANVAGPFAYGQLPAEVQQVPINFCWSGKPIASSNILVPITMALTLPANLAGSRGKVLTTNPAATASFTLNSVNLGAIGTISVNTSGVFTFPTVASKSLAAGDTLYITAPSTQDANMTDVAINILANRV